MDFEDAARQAIGERKQRETELRREDERRRRYESVAIPAARAKIEQLTREAVLVLSRYSPAGTPILKVGDRKAKVVGHAWGHEGLCLTPTGRILQRRGRVYTTVIVFEGRAYYDEWNRAQKKEGRLIQPAGKVPDGWAYRDIFLAPSYEVTLLADPPSEPVAWLSSSEDGTPYYVRRGGTDSDDGECLPLADKLAELIRHAVSR